MKKLILLSVLVLSGFQAMLFAQGNNVTVQSLQGTHIDTILKYHLAGEGVELSNGRFNNQPGIVNSNQIGSFQRNNFLTFPFETGLIMTTGACSVAAGPNSSGSASSAANIPYTDALLQQYNQGYTVMNSAALDFDFLAYADTFAFHYVFGSEEYPSFVCQIYNDMFIFLLTGPDPVTGMVTTKNVAVVPGTVTAANPNGLPVSISTINGGGGNTNPGCYNGTYSAYYISNGSGNGANGIEYNGYTVELSAEGVINACDTYHMHLAICNGYDNSYDSGVFLEGKSFKSELSTKLLMRNSYCLHESIQFNYQAENVDTVFILTPNGDTLWAPYLIESAEISDSGLYYLYVHKAIQCANIWAYDSIHIEVINTYKPDLGDDQWLCTGEVVTLNSNYTDSTAILTWNTGDVTPSIDVITSGEYIIEIEMLNPNTNTYCWSSDTVNINFWPLPKPDFEADVTSGCTPVTSRFTNLTTTTSDSISCEWYVFDQNYSHLVDYSPENSPVFHFNDAGSYTIKLVITTAEGCKDSIIKYNYILTSPQPNIDFLATPEICMMSETNGSIDFTAYLSDNVTGNTNNHLVWSFGDGEQTEEETNTTHVYSTWGDYIVTLSLTTEAGCGDSVSHTIVIEDDLRFPNVITPNGDGINDVWAIENLNTDINAEDPDEYRHNELRISDRYGKVVFHVQNYDTWSKDGQIHTGLNPFNGEGLNDGVYYYTFTYKGKAKTTQWHGSITIIR